MGTYEIGAIMQRAPNTVRKYLTSPMFTDDKFRALVEEYKQKEILDLTTLNIESRARLHDLVPVMTPIEAIALMDKSFTQRRLLEGKSTENIFSLRAIIVEADKADEPNAPHAGKEQSSHQLEHSHGDSSREAAEAGSGDSSEHSSSGKEEAQDAEIVP